MKVRDLAPGEGISLQCAVCQSTVHWSKAAPELTVGAGADLNHISQHERLRCRGCGQAPSNAWPSWQQQ
jgi:hypothetical protein